MAIGKTIVEQSLARTRLLSEAVAWIEAFDTKTKEQMISWIQNDQLRLKGVDKFDNEIGTYSYATQLISKGRKQQGNHYTLDDTGAFFASMYVTVGLDAVKIDAGSITFDEMKKQKWYRDAIIGLNDENFRKLKEIIKAEFINYARKVLFGSR